MLNSAGVRSRAIRAVGYDIAARELHVVYAGGGHYLYRKVPPRRVKALLETPSAGRFVNLRIKPCFPYEEITRRAPPVPRRLR